MRREEVIQTITTEAVEAYALAYRTPGQTNSELNQFRGKVDAYCKALSLLRNTDEDEEFDRIVQVYHLEYDSYDY